MIGYSHISPDFFLIKGAKLGPKRGTYLNDPVGPPLHLFRYVWCVCMYVCVHALLTSVTPLGLLCTCSGMYGMGACMYACMRYLPQ